MKSITVEVWGDFACFSRPENKVERFTYPVITPSAARGILASIYSKPSHFYWQVKKIEVLKPIQFISFKRNEVINSKIKASTTLSAPILVEETEKHRTQRQSVVLKDVRYRITAEIIKRKDYTERIDSLYNQAQRRIDHGKCFCQPSLGLREFVCYFDNPSKLEPINESMDLGLMLYDVFDLDLPGVVKEKELPYITLFNAKMENGIINVPDFHDESVLHPEKGVNNA